ncbi:phosphoenolpyruvate synthase [Roseivirga echinicomitans]|uniref:Phosphoenolpyruvate synthase n=1 Tax=Roseivirga echinicomitans TaxID=296218 RepID=A0A150XUP9_9BACT|nr:phosphoenolpyruvate synthase [Roseivirga echinicomitans]KYG82460.1 phosphoenolpyruvate synthase [Roseivirga echinicomitans]
MKNEFILPLEAVDIHQVGIVGGKNASLGEMIQKLSSQGINVPGGFVLTAKAYWHFLDQNDIREKLVRLMNRMALETNLHESSKEARQLILEAEIPNDLSTTIIDHFRIFLTQHENGQVAVRSSATAEDLPEDSFAGMQETYLNISTEDELLLACKHCYASLFTARAIKYREDKGYDHMLVALSIGVQQMIRSDLASSGVAFTLDPNTGFNKVVAISASWGLGENIVKGEVTPDEFCVYKKGLLTGEKSILSKKKGSKEKTMIYATGSENSDWSIASKTINQDTPVSKRQMFALEDEEIEKLAHWCLLIEKHYGGPMDIEWAKDGLDGQLYIVQARPETVHSQRSGGFSLKEFELLSMGEILVKGAGVGTKIVSGKARLLDSPEQIDKLQEGEILVTHITSPDWDPILKKVSAIITDRGGVTSHAAIIARETGAAAIVGTTNGTEVIKDGQLVTVVCDGSSNGVVYAGALQWEERDVDTSNLKMPEIDVMLILADPEQAFKWSFLPVDGVGLVRIEFAISNSIQIHPMALAHFDAVNDPEVKARIEELTIGYKDKKQYFVDQLSQSIATIAAAFDPREVIVRMSDFKTNEYAHLIGGKQFEPEETNAMLGWRGASRYYNKGYKDGFDLECQAMKIVRDKMGLTNVKLMIPFCRTEEEGKRVLAIMEQNGLKRGENGLEIYVMVEVPSNVFCADAFAEIFDGFSIGSNDLTQLILGVDRDSEMLRELFDINNKAVKRAISAAILAAKNAEIPIGLCGQAPSDHPEFAKFLVKEGITSISFNPDAAVKGIEAIREAEMNVQMPTTPE